MTTTERFLEKISPEPNSGCWLWMGATNNNGYGVTGVNGKNKLAHRVAYQLLHGVDSVGMDLDHLCRVRCCVNPHHLEPVSHRENILRGDGPALAKRNIALIHADRRARTHCAHGHEYTDANTLIRRRGDQIWRACRRCSSIAVAKFKARRKVV